MRRSASRSSRSAGRHCSCSARSSSRTRRSGASHGLDRWDSLRSRSSQSRSQSRTRFPRTSKCRPGRRSRPRQPRAAPTCSAPRRYSTCIHADPGRYSNRVRGSRRFPFTGGIPGAATLRWMATSARRPLTRTDVLSARELAELLGIPRSTVHELARRRDLPARRVGRRWLFLRDKPAAAITPLDDPVAWRPGNGA